MRRLMLFVTASLLTATVYGQPDDYQENPEGYCARVQTRCFDQCIGPAIVCHQATNFDPICDEQYNSCMEDCYGIDSFWCGYEAV